MNNDKITSWTGEFWFLDNSYEVPIIFQNLGYPSVSHAYLAAQTESIDLKIRIAHSPLIALKALWNEVGTPHSGFEGPNTMRKLLEYKFGYKQDTSAINMTDLQSNLAKRLLSTTTKTLVYENKTHSNFLGVCTCPKHINERGKNVLGGLIMGIRERLVDYVTQYIDPKQTCSCEANNDAFFLYSREGKLWLKPFCREHQSLAAMAAAKQDDHQMVMRFEKDWFPKKKEPVNKIIVPHRSTIRPDVFTQTDDDDDEYGQMPWSMGWGVNRQEPLVVNNPPLPKNITMYLSGRIK